MKNSRKAFLRQQAVLDRHREVLQLTRAVVAEWAARHNDGACDRAAASIIELLSPAVRDVNGDATLDAISDVFEQWSDLLPVSVIAALADLGQAAHDCGRLRSVYVHYIQ